MMTKQNNQLVIYPGTFDPITNGHINIIERAAALFSHVVVAIAANPGKKPMFTLEQRMQYAQQSSKHLANVEVTEFSGLFADLVVVRQASAVIRGIRTATDFEYERQLSHLNRLLTQGIETVFLPSSEQWAYLSSTMVKEVALHGGDISRLVPASVLAGFSTHQV